MHFHLYSVFSFNNTDSEYKLTMVLYNAIDKDKRRLNLDILAAVLFDFFSYFVALRAARQTQLDKGSTVSSF